MSRSLANDRRQDLARVTDAMDPALMRPHLFILHAACSEDTVRSPKIAEVTS